MDFVQDSDEISERNKELIFDFKLDLSLNDMSAAWLQNLLSRLKVMVQTVDFDFDDASEDDFKDLVEEIQKRDITDRTVLDYKKVLKRFYGWLNGGEDPEKVEWIKTTDRSKNGTLPEDVLTEEDVQEPIDSTTSSRTQAFIALLGETGARIGELMDLSVGDLRDHKHGMQIVIDGKTEQRRIPLISSIPQIRKWLNDHPNPGDNDAPLWAKFQQSGKGERVSYRYILKSLKNAGENAGIDKPMNPYHFRHSRATYLANKFTEAQMCEWFGWVQRSDVPAKYVHMSGREIDADYARLHGIEDEEEPEESQLAPEECPRCGAKNNPEASFCQNCGQTLTREAFEGVEKHEEKSSGILSEMVSEKEAEQIISAAKKLIEERTDQEEM